MKFQPGAVVGVFGLPCSGKTTVIRSLIDSSREVLAYISSGDIARKLSDESDIKHMSEGNLYPHENKLREEIYNTINKRRNSGAQLIFVDGFPRFDDQVVWLLENRFMGGLDGCLLQIIGDNLSHRAKLRYRDDQDSQDKLLLKIKEQSGKIDAMEKLIMYYSIPYHCILNVDLEIAVKQMVKFLGLRK